MEFKIEYKVLYWIDGENYVYGYRTDYGTNKMIGAYFNEAFYNKEIGWKRKERGACSKRFVEWVEKMENEIRAKEWI